MAGRRGIVRGALGAAVLLTAATGCVLPDPTPPTTTTTTTPSSTTTAPPTTTTAPPTTTTTTAPPSSITKYSAIAASCRTVASISTSYDANNTGVTAVYPSYVTAGSNFQIQLTADPMTIPSSGGGYPISYLKTVKVRFAVPVGTTYVGATLSGGSNLGTGTPSVAQSGGIVTLTVPGTLAGGSVAVLPTVTVTLKATGSVGSLINTSLYGNSYDNWSISFIAHVTNVPLFGSLDATAQCYAATNPVLATVPIA